MYERPMFDPGIEIDALKAEIARLREALKLHAGDTMSLSNELDEWRERALAAELPLCRKQTAVEDWIDREYAGHGVAIRTKSDPAIPGEPFMSMADAKELTRRALREIVSVPNGQ